MPTSLDCPRCGFRHELDQAPPAGKLVRCGRCRRTFRFGAIPATPATPPPEHTINLVSVQLTGKPLYAAVILIGVATISIFGYWFMSRDSHTPAAVSYDAPMAMKPATKTPRGMGLSASDLRRTLLALGKWQEENAGENDSDCFRMITMGDVKLVCIGYPPEENLSSLRFSLLLPRPYPSRRMVGKQIELLSSLVLGILNKPEEYDELVEDLSQLYDEFRKVTKDQYLDIRKDDQYFFGMRFLEMPQMGTLYVDVNPLSN